MKWFIQTLYELKLGPNSTFIPWPILQPSLPRFFLLLQRKIFDIQLVSNFYNVLDSHFIQTFFIPFSHTEDLMWTQHNSTECCIRTSVLMKRSVQTNVLNEKKSRKGKNGTRSPEPCCTKLLTVFFFCKRRMVFLNRMRHENL